MLNKQNIFKHSTLFSLLIVGFFMLYPVVSANGTCTVNIPLNINNCALGSMTIQIPAVFAGATQIQITVSGNSGVLQAPIILNLTANQNAGNGSVSPTANIIATPASISSGGLSVISWACGGGATSGSVSPTGWTGLSGSNSTGALTANQTYTVTCSGGASPTPATASVTVMIGGTPGTAPTAIITALPTSVLSGANSVISWTCGGGATSGSVSPDNWTGLTGSQSSGALTSAKTYTLTCSETGFTDATANVSVVINNQTGAVAGITCNPSSCSVPSATSIGFTNSSTP